MNNERLKQILERHIDNFKNNIAFELETSHDQLFEGFGFPIFGETSKDYHEQVYFQSYLESYTRKMVNAILKEIIDFEVCDKFIWPEFEYKGIYRGYTNSEYEKEFIFEFINIDRSIGYRYCSFHWDEIDTLLSEGGVDAIRIILWEDENGWPYFCYDDNRIKVIMVYDLFQELFGELSDDEIRSMYDLFIEEVAKAVEEANSMISITTVPGFTTAFLHKTRAEVVSGLEKEVSSAKVFFVQNPNYKYEEDNSRELVDIYKLNQMFLQNKYSHAFVGNEHFAKSFLTSEYLYRYFKKNPMFDYTPIVSGYIKSIEQLLLLICKNYSRSKNFKVKTRNKNKIETWNLGNYMYFIDDNEQIIRSEIRCAKKHIIACLKSYIFESRNHLFHKDYFDSWMRVERIRKNTIFLYFTLLGMINQKLIFGNYNKPLRMLDDTYDQLFYTVDKANASDHFLIELNGKTYSNMQKSLRLNGILYDENGMIKNKIVFWKFDYDHYVNIEISPENIPSYIWISNSQGNKLIWKLDE